MNTAHPNRSTDHVQLVYSLITVGELIAFGDVERGDRFLSEAETLAESLSKAGVEAAAAAMHAAVFHRVVKCDGPHRLAEQEAMLRRALAVSLPSLASHAHRKYAGICDFYNCQMLADILVETDRHDEALNLFRLLWEQSKSPPCPHVSSGPLSQVHSRWLSALLAMGRDEDAIVLCRETIGVLENGPHPAAAWVVGVLMPIRDSLADLLEKAGRADEARRMLAETAQSLRSEIESGRTRWGLSTRSWHSLARAQLARIECRLGHLDEALRQVEADVDAGSTLVLEAIPPGQVVVAPPAFRAALIALVDRMFEGKVADIGYYRGRGSFYAAIGEFSAARRDFEASVAAGDAGGHAGWLQRHYRALCYLRDADQAAYREAAREIADRFATSQDRHELYWTVWTCVLAPGAMDDSALLVDLARQGRNVAAGDPLMNQILGAALFRAGQFERALEALERSEIGAMPSIHVANLEGGRAYAWYFRAMTCFELGQADEARHWYDKAVAETAKSLEDKGTSWNRRLTLELLRAESARLLGVTGDDDTRDDETRPNDQ
ncbi:MAG: tetratricopeptide repeat protein [Planctomycetaceae bacterium]|nr:tetratricopeptide repeat protein [Planctomycetaceae bacterium]